MLFNAISAIIVIGVILMQPNSEMAEYVDTEGALSRIGGNMAIYKRLLGRFLEGNHYEQLDTALKGSDPEAAIRQAHSLKGVSANLSLVKINSHTVQLEHLLKDGADYTSCMEELKDAFQVTTEMIAGILDS